MSVLALAKSYLESRVEPDYQALDGMCELSELMRTKSEATAPEPRLEPFATVPVPPYVHDPTDPFAGWSPTSEPIR